MNEHDSIVDPFFDPLEKLTYESIYEAFRDVGSERLRLEFKETLDPEELARQAVAMANGEGGIVIVGFADPKDGVALQKRDFVGDIDEPGRRRLMSKIQSKVYPSVPIECAGYTSKNSDRLLLMRVEPSDVAPHERMSDRGRFIVRRGTETTGMTLRELELLILRRDRGLARWGQHDDDVGVDNFSDGGSLGMVVFDRNVEERFVGATLQPETSVIGRPLSRAEQHNIERIVRNLDGLNAASPQTYANGILFENDRTAPEGVTVTDTYRLLRRSRVAYVGADGSAELRFQINNRDYKAALIQIICTIYALGSQLFLELGIGPRASGAVHLHRGNPPDVEAHQPSGGQYQYHVNFATDSVEQMARRPIMYALRSAGILSEPDEVDKDVSAYWKYAYSGLGSMRQLWR